MKSKLFTLVIAMLVVMALTCTAYAAEYTISLGHINSESDSWHLGALAFEEYVEEHSDGRIAVEVYPNSQLGSEIDMLTAKNSGLDCICVDWGFRGKDFLTDHEAKIIVSDCDELYLALK